MPIDSGHYQQRKITVGPRAGQEGWYDSKTSQFMPSWWVPPEGSAPATPEVREPRTLVGAPPTTPKQLAPRPAAGYGGEKKAPTPPPVHPTPTPKPPEPTQSGSGGSHHELKEMIRQEISNLLEPTEEAPAPPPPSKEELIKLDKTRTAAQKALENPNHPMNRHRDKITDVTIPGEGGKPTTIRTLPDSPDTTADDHHEMAKMHALAAESMASLGDYEGAINQDDAARWHQRVVQQKAAQPAPPPKSNLPDWMRQPKKGGLPDWMEQPDKKALPDKPLVLPKVPRPAGLSERAGWKLHLATDHPEDVSKVLKSLGLTHKVGRSGGQEGKDLTVYMGSKDAANVAAQAINEHAGHLLKEPHGDTVRDDTPFGGRVVGRFDADGDREFHQYGSKGIPHLQEDMDPWNPAPPGARDRAHASLEKKYGEFYTGESPQTQPLPTPPNARDDLVKLDRERTAQMRGAEHDGSNNPAQSTPSPTVPVDDVQEKASRPRFKPGGRLEKYGGKIAKFGETTMDIIPSPKNPKTAHVRWLEGRDVASHLPDIVDALKHEGFTDIDYDPADEGRKAARVRLFESLRRKYRESVGQSSSADTQPSVKEAAPTSNKRVRLAGAKSDVTGVLTGVEKGDHLEVKWDNGISAMIPKKDLVDQETSVAQPVSPQHDHPKGVDESNTGVGAQGPIKPIGNSRQDLVNLDRERTAQMRGAEDTTPSPEPYKHGDALPSHDSWRQLEPDPDYFYHATNADNVADIQSDALRTHRPWHGTKQSTWPDGSTAQRSYFSDKPSTAWQFAPEEGTPALVRMKKHPEHKAESGTGDYYIQGKKVPPHRLEVLTAGGWKPLAHKEGTPTTSAAVQPGATTNARDDLIKLDRDWMQPAPSKVQSQVAEQQGPKEVESTEQSSGARQASPLENLHPEKRAHMDRIQQAAHADMSDPNHPVRRLKSDLSVMKLPSGAVRTLWGAKAAQLSSADREALARMHTRTAAALHLIGDEGGSKAQMEVAQYHRSGAEKARKREVAEAEKYQKQASEAHWRQHPVLKHFAHKLNMKDLDVPEVQDHLEHLAKLQPDLVRAVVNSGLSGVYVGDGGVPGLDQMDHLKGVRPRGWSEGKTWDSVGGCYSNGNVIAGNAEGQSASTVLHEFGHALGDIFKLNRTNALVEHHQRLFNKLAEYFQQGGPGALAGRQELLAEGFAAVVMDRDKAVSDYDEQFVKWIEHAVNEIMLAHGKAQQTSSHVDDDDIELDFQEPEASPSARDDLIKRDREQTAQMRGLDEKSQEDSSTADHGGGGGGGAGGAGGVGGADSRAEDSAGQEEPRGIEELGRHPEAQRINKAKEWLTSTGLKPVPRRSGTFDQGAAIFRTRDEYEEQGKKTLAAARAAGLVIPESKFRRIIGPEQDGDNQIGGGEHRVYVDAENNRVLKITHGPGHDGMFGFSEDAYSYLDRLEISNALWPSLGYKFEGVIDEYGRPLIATTMNFISGAHPEQEEIHDWFRSNGWVPTGEPDETTGDKRYLNWKDPVTGTVIGDTHQGNFLKTAGGLVPIDVVISKGDREKPQPAPPPEAARASDSTTSKLAAASIASNKSLSTEQRRDYQGAVDKVSGYIPRKGHELIADAMKKGAMHFYADPFEVNNGLWDEIEKAKPTWVKIHDFVFKPKSVRDAEKRDNRMGRTFMAPAAYNSATSGLHIDGKDLANTPNLFGEDMQEHALHHLYAHELTHVIDHDRRFSKSPEWQEAWQEEIVNNKALTEYGETEPVEGFAEMGRAIYGGGVDLRKVEENLPKCSQFFKDNGLWPEEPGQKAQVPAPPPMFSVKDRVSWPDGHADSLIQLGEKSQQTPKGPTTRIGRVWHALFGKEVGKSASGKDLKTPYESAAVKAALEGTSSHSLHASGLSGSYQDTFLTDVMHETGRSGAPRVLPSHEVDRLVNEHGWTPMYRALEKPEHVEQFRSGELYNGAGIYGNGTYVAKRRPWQTGEGKALQAVEQYGQHKMRVAVPPNARTVSYEALGKKRAAFYNQLTKDVSSGKIDMDQYQKMLKIVEDFGRFAALLNYDMIDASTASGSGYCVILNRSMLAVQKENV